MNELIIWNTGSGKGESGKGYGEEWTILYGNKSYVIGADAAADPKNIEAIVGVDITWMDGKYNRVDAKSIPESIVKAIKARA